MKNNSVVFKLSLKFSAILTMAVLLIIFFFFLALRNSSMQQENRGFNRTLNNLTAILESENYQFLDKKLKELPFFISYIIYDNETKEILLQRDDRLGILPRTGSKPKHYSTKKLFNQRQIDIVYKTASVQLKSGRSVTIQLASNTNRDAPNKFIGEMLTLIALASIPILIISFFISLFITRQTMKPVVEITSAAKTISSSNLDQRLPQTGNHDELDNLATTFNDLFHRLKNDFDQERSFTSNVSHELKTPVSVILGQTNLLRRWGKDDSVQMEKSLDSILKETRSMESIISNLLQLSRLDSGKIQTQISEVSINNLFDRLKEEFNSIYPECKIIYSEKEYEAFYSDEELLHQVFTAIISNSGKFVKENLTVELRCNQSDGKTVIEIEDNGPGFSEDVLPHIFERFYRGDKSHNREKGGSGLGLSIAKAIVESLDGTIAASNGRNGGALLTVTLKTKPLEQA